MNNFYLTISNTSLDENHDNKISNWKTQLPSNLRLNDEYEVGLAQISYTFSWYNLFDDQIVTIVYFDETKKEVDFKINKGYYSIENIIESIQSIINRFCRSKQCKRPMIYLVSLDHIDYVGILFGRYNGKLLGIKLSPLLGNILGMDHEDLAAKVDANFAWSNLDGDPKVVTYRAKTTYDVKAGYHTLFVYTDIIDPILLGDNLSPLLRIVDIPRNKVWGHQVTINYEDVEYRKISQNEIKSIEIQIADDSGQDIQFNTMSDIILVLHFKKINKST